jgi:hypothetical protein
LECNVPKLREKEKRERERERERERVVAICLRVGSNEQEHGVTILN